MYATGIGLVIEGLNRAEYDKLRRNEGGIKKKGAKDNKQGGNSGTSRFLEGIKNWFASDTDE